MEEKKIVTPKNKKVLFIVAAVLVAVVALICAYSAFLVSAYGGGNTVAKGITVDGTDIGGMTVSEAVGAINDAKAALAENTVELIMDSKNTTALFSEFTVAYNTEEVAQEAFDYGKKGNIFSRIVQCRKIKKGKVNLETEAEVNPEDVSDYVSAFSQSVGSTVVENYYAINGDKLELRNGKPGDGIDEKLIEEEIIQVLKSGQSGKIGINFVRIDPAPWDVSAMYEEICTEPSNASYEERDGKGYIVEAKKGYKFKKKDLEKLISENKDNEKTYTLELEVLEPEVTKVDESGLFKEVISEYTSSLAGSDSNRRNNVAVACASVNGTVLNPGEVFSFNKQVGAVTAAAGYKDATIFTAKGQEPGMGGGICQVSSTIYSAALYGNLEIVKRRNHMYIVGYVPYGQDATVYEGELDFRFANNTNEPLKVYCEIVGGNVVVKMLGKKPDPSLTVEIENVTVARTQPNTIVEEDATLDEGTVKVSSKGTIGLTVDTYKKIFKNGKLVSRDYLHRSVYKPINRVEIHGTKPVDTPAQAEPANETALPTEGGENTAQPETVGAGENSIPSTGETSDNNAYSGI